MTSYVSADIRRIVTERANDTCEYCLIHSSDTHVGLQVDHVISEKHGGKTQLDNLALACAFCNRFKGSDVGSISKETKEFVRFFNPRVDKWQDHFEIDSYRVVGRTLVGEVTLFILKLNEPDRIIERQLLQMAGRGWPPQIGDV